MESPHEVLNFGYICRVCMTSDSKLTNIFKVFFDSEALVQLLERHFFVNIKQDDQLPQNMCQTCIYEIHQIHAFIKKYKSSEEKLQTILHSTDEVLIISVEDKEEEDGGEVKEDVEEVANHEEQISNEEQTDGGNDIDDEEIEEKLRPLRLPEQGPPYSCNICCKVFDQLIDIELHRKQEKHLRKLEYVCSICNDGKVYQYQGCVVHLRTHTKERPYRCDYCDLTFTTGSNRNRHLRTHTGERPHMCETCGRGFAVSSSLKNHNCISSHNKIFKCKHCSTTYTRYTSYAQHLRTHRNENSTEQYSYECDQCNKKFAKKCILATHKVLHSEKMYLCNKCGKKFHHKGSLNSHIKIHLGERPHKCGVCDKSFLLPATLVKHQRVHTGERPFECDVCKKRFRQLTHLRTHMKVHNGAKMFECSYCCKTFLLKGTLTVHMRTHTGETPYVCDICNKGFYDSTSMKSHRKRHKV